MDNKRDTFSGKIGFVFAAAGSAVGLGNLWRFPYLAAKYGGGIFILVLFAALSSSISLLETNVSILSDKLHWDRKKSTIVAGTYVIIMGSTISLGFGPLSFIKIIGLGLLDFFDFISNSVLMPDFDPAVCSIRSNGMD